MGIGLDVTSQPLGPCRICESTCEMTQGFCILTSNLP